MKRLQSTHPALALPARRTIFHILARNDRARRRRSRTHWKHPGAAPLQTTAPNQVWTIDFKGQFRTRDGVYSYPLTIVGHFRRYLLCCLRFPDVKLQRRVFNTFVQTYNEVRPHEALNDETPASRWRPSASPLPRRIIPPTYPGHFEIRRVSTAGIFRLHNGQQFLTQALNGEMIGLEEVQNGLWNVLYYDTLLGRFDERTRTITGAPPLKNDC